MLDKLQTKTEVGINQIEYGNSLADLKYAYKQIEDEKEKEAFEKLIKIHEVTYTFWKECYSSEYAYNCPTEGQPMQLVLTSFPEIKDKQDDYTMFLLGAYQWNTNSVLSELWTIADRELEKIEL
ncbi:hypothetical protein C7B62_05635 [Pleurocapsa sp. CCALA 161]|uniref:hypothetical protein n=1 Tax=Pleurocapsa sp. CCALA 161 TaxID=2107688 RepID=UPI000D060F91|nr:hypothetical protein [Pleurocapsa sp. CCALA 161]PSB11387.1 hypothetical protein C7B62_05635 [Pleurocapsa sp. CCALA 161]